MALETIARRTKYAGAGVLVVRNVHSYYVSASAIGICAGTGGRNTCWCVSHDGLYVPMNRIDELAVFVCPMCDQTITDLRLAADPRMHTSGEYFFPEQAWQAPAAETTGPVLGRRRIKIGGTDE